MRELLDLQTGHVAFISGLMSGFFLTIAVCVLRYGICSRMAQMVFPLFLLWQDINGISANLEKLQ